MRGRVDLGGARGFSGSHLDHAENEGQRQASLPGVAHHDPGDEAERPAKQAPSTEQEADHQRAPQSTRFT